MGNCKGEKSLHAEGCHGTQNTHKRSLLGLKGRGMGADPCVTLGGLSWERAPHLYPPGKPHHQVGRAWNCRRKG